MGQWGWRKASGHNTSLCCLFLGLVLAPRAGDSGCGTNPGFLLCNRPGLLFGSRFPQSLCKPPVPSKFCSYLRPQLW